MLFKNNFGKRYVGFLWKIQKIKFKDFEEGLNKLMLFYIYV